MLVPGEITGEGNYRKRNEAAGERAFRNGKPNEHLHHWYICLCTFLGTILQPSRMCSTKCTAKCFPALIHLSVTYFLVKPFITICWHSQTVHFLTCIYFRKHQKKLNYVGTGWYLVRLEEKRKGSRHYYSNVKCPEPDFSEKANGLLWSV